MTNQVIPPTLVKQFKSHPHAILCVVARAGH
eukprot:COSAG04_NODE_13230_length_614_cov_1.141748_1_plen_30_part_10